MLRKLRNAFAHSAESASLTDDTHRMRLEAVYLEARVNPLWGPLQAVLAAQPPSAHGPLDEALRDYILLITILVAFLEATAKQLKPIKPPVVMRFAGIGKGNWGQPGPWRSRQAGERGSALATCCAEGRRSSLSRSLRRAIRSESILGRHAKRLWRLRKRKTWMKTLKPLQALQPWLRGGLQTVPVIP